MVLRLLLSRIVSAHAFDIQCVRSACLLSARREDLNSQAGLLRLRDIQVDGSVFERLDAETDESGDNSSSLFRPHSPTGCYRSADDP